MRVNRTILCALAILAMANAALGDSRLLFAEAQMVAGYAFDGPASQRLYYYSMDQMDVMQKPSVGFDLVQRLSSETGDWGMFAVQARLAYDKTRNGKVEPQLYNAYLKVKPAFGDIWLGHNKPAFGLAMSLDNHGTLLQPLSMYGYGYDRDWGTGYYRDFESGNLAFSATLGSGMPVIIGKNYLLSGRISKGDLNQQNYNVGLSASYGQVLETMGYYLIPGRPWEEAKPQLKTMLGADGTALNNRWENRLEAMWIRRTEDHGHAIDTQSAFVLFHRVSFNLLSEYRLKLELQHFWEFGANDEIGRIEIGSSYQLTPDLSVKAALLGDRHGNGKAVAQLYWYHKL